MTLPANPDLVKALKKIGQGLLDLADALAPVGSSDKPKPRSAESSSPHAPSPAEEKTEEQEEIKLADLQTLAKNLIKKDRPAMVKILENHELANVSSAPEELYADLKSEMEEALG